MTCAVGHLVVDERVVVDVLCLVGNYASVAPTLCSLALEQHVETVACRAVVQRYDVVVNTAVGLLLNVDVRHTRVLIVDLLHAVEVKRCVASHISLNDLCCEKLAVVGSMVTEQQFGFSALLHDDEHATVHHERHVRAQDVDDLYGAVHLHAPLHIDEQTILCQHGVEGCYAILVGMCELRIMVSHKLRVRLSIGSERVDHHALGQVLLGLQGSAELVVNDKIERCAEVRHVATERLVGVYRNLQTVNVDAIVGCEQLVNACIFVSLYLS